MRGGSSEVETGADSWDDNQRACELLGVGVSGKVHRRQGCRISLRHFTIRSLRQFFTTGAVPLEPRSIRSLTAKMSHLSGSRLNMCAGPQITKAILRLRAGCSAFLSHARTANRSQTFTPHYEPCLSGWLANSVQAWWNAPLRRAFHGARH